MAWYDRFLGINREETEEKLNPSQYVISRNEGMTVDSREVVTNYRNAYEQLEIVDSSTKKEELEQEIIIESQKKTNLERTIIRADKADKIKSDEPNLTTGQFFIWSIFLTITRSIVIICGVFILILLFTGIHQLFAKKTKRKGSAGW